MREEILEEANGCKESKGVVMIREALYHRIESEYAYALNRETLVIRLRAARGDLRECRVVYRDRHVFAERPDAWISAAMRRGYLDDAFDYFEALLKVRRGIVYYFFLEGQDGSRYYFSEDGLLQDVPHDWRRLFCYPDIRKGDLFLVPPWLKYALIYQVLPDRFCNGDRANDPPGCVSWHTLPTGTSEHFGGDLAGIVEKIPYLKALGVNALYLNPIFHSPSNHKYDTVDYFDVDPAFGTKETLATLVRVCHDQGIRVILDAPFNHCGVGFFAFEDVRRRGPESPYVSWFDIKSFPVKVDGRANYTYFGCSPSMPKLMTGNPEVARYLLDAAAYWIREADIDGWRVDVADEIDRSFLVKLRDTVKKAKSDAVLVGEVWCDPRSWLQGDIFDTVINYGFTWLMEDYFVSGELTSQELGNRLSRMYASQKTQVQDVLINLISSHDVPRFLTLCGGAESKFLLALLLMFTCKGVPLLYYGDEIGMEGGPDPDCRRAMVWDEERQNKRILEYVRKLSALRSQISALTEGTFEVLQSGDVDVFSFVRRHPCGNAYVLCNRSRSPKAVVLNPVSEECCRLRDVLAEKEYAVERGQSRLFLGPVSGCVLIPR